ncbi:phytoene dehydrogenase [Halobacteriales archaeon SW_7_68_16]|nr:MAG: phytoene dehydrogenase [Halobacteriales archaeon SW_7_68_16]
MNRTIAVIGGGLAGLVAARRLAAAGHDVTLYERDDAVGGRVASTTVDGFTVDRGFQVFFTSYPALTRELDVDALDLRPFRPGAWLCRADRRSLLSDPFRDPRAALATTFNTDITLRDKIEVVRLRRDLRARSAADLFAGPDTTIRDFLRSRGFSESFVREFAAPFYGGITLDRSLTTSKRVFEYTFRALATGRIGVPADGMGAIPRQLRVRAEAAGARIETGTEVTALAADDAATVEIDGGVTRAVDAVVVATDPPTARELTGVESIPTEGRGCVTQWLRGPADLDLATGRRLLLNATGEEPNLIVPHSEVAPEYAPDDETLLCASFLGERDAGPATLATAVREALAAWYPDRRFGGLRPIATQRLPFAQFDQPPGVHDSLPDVRAPEGPVYLAGEYTGWSSIQAAAESGGEAARAAIADLPRT